MADTLKARDAKDVEAAVQWLLAEGKAVEIVGHGSKRAIGRPAQTDVTLDLSALSGVTLYQPEGLLLSAKGGTSSGKLGSLRGPGAPPPSRWIAPPFSAARLGAGPSAACWRPTYLDLAGSKLVRRATICSAFPRCPVGARASSPAAGW